MFCKFLVISSTTTIRAASTTPTTPRVTLDTSRTATLKRRAASSIGTSILFKLLMQHRHPQLMLQHVITSAE